MSRQEIIPVFDLYKTLDNSLGFEFSLLEESYNPYDATLPHRHNYFEILMFNGSGGNHEIDFNYYAIEKNSLHFISPEQVHLLRREKHVTGYVLSFTKDFFLETSGSDFTDTLPFFGIQGAFPVVRAKDDEQQLQLNEIVSKIQSEYFSMNSDKAELLLPFMKVFLITAKRMYAPETIAGKYFYSRSEVAQKFKKLVDANFRQNKSVSDYAALLNITSGHLSDTVHKDTGKTAGDIIHERIILEAKRLLYHSPKSVKEIAYELQYEDPSYFTRFFKTHTQLTPEQFREDIRKKYH